MELRLLIENAVLSNCGPMPDTENMLIHGGNLLALKALERKYAGQVKCVYIEMRDSSGKNCFPDSKNVFDVTINIRFHANSTLEGVLRARKALRNGQR